MKKILALLLALNAISFTFAADQKAAAPVADKAKAAEKCDDGSCCDDDAKPAAKDAKQADAKATPAKKEAAKPAEKK